MELKNKENKYLFFIPATKNMPIIRLRKTGEEWQEKKAPNNQSSNEGQWGHHGTRGK